MRPRVHLAIAGAIGAALGACRAADPVAACVRAEQAHAPDATARCRAAAARGSLVARASLVSLAFHDGRLEEVVAAAAAVPAEVAGADREPAARIWHLGGEASLMLRREDTAWPLFERAFAATADGDQTRRSKIALRLADHALDTDDVEGAATLLRTAIEAAGRGGSEADELDARIDAASDLLRLGDVRPAEALLDAAAPLTERVAWYRPALSLLRGDAAAMRGRPLTAAELYRRCADEATAADARGDGSDADVAVRCHQRLGVLALRPPIDVARAEAEVAAAGARVDEAARAYGADPDRDAGVEHLRALIDRGHGRTADALARWAALWRAPMGAGTRVQIGLGYADALLATGDAARAEAILRDAFDAVVALRDRHEVQEARRGLPESLRSTAEALVPLLVARGDARGALAIIEQAQRRDFSDRLLSEAGDLPAFAGAPARELGALFAGVAQTEGARRRLARADVRDAPTATAPAIVGFWSDPRALWRITVPAEGAPVIERIAERAWLDPRVEAARAAPDGDAATELGATLLPRGVLPARGRPLVIVPDPAIAGLALAALGVEGAPLVERNPIAIAPSFGTAWAWAARDDGAIGPAVVLGDPGGDLPGAAAEARAVAARLGVEPHLGAAADRRALEAGAHARVLHVAAHAAVDGTEIVLHLAGGDVTIAELVGLGLTPRTAVVASCASAAQRPDAMWSSTAAALAVAGARTVVGALRSLDDDTTRALIDDFYQAGGAEDATTALAIAQRRARARGVPAAAWAFLVVYGAPASPEAAAPAASTNQPAR